MPVPTSGSAASRPIFAAHAYRNTRTDDLWPGGGSRGRQGPCRTIAHDFTPPARRAAHPASARSPCVAGQKPGPSSPRTSSRADRRAGLPSPPLSWHVPVKLSIVGGEPVTALTSGREDAGDGAWLRTIARSNVGQTGYYRTLYPAAAAEQLRANFTPHRPARRIWPRLTTNWSCRKPATSRWPIGLDLVAAIPVSGAGPSFSRSANSYWAGLYKEVRQRCRRLSA